MKNLNSVINKYRRALSNTLLMDVERYEPGINSYYTVVTSLGKNISIAMMNPIKTSCGFKEEWEEV